MEVSRHRETEVCRRTRLMLLLIHYGFLNLFLFTLFNGDSEKKGFFFLFFHYTSLIFSYFSHIRCCGHAECHVKVQMEACGDQWFKLRLEG